MMATGLNKDYETLLLKKCKIPNYYKQCCIAPKESKITEKSTQQRAQKKIPKPWKIYEVKRRLILKLGMEVGSAKQTHPDNSCLAEVLQSTPQNLWSLEESLRNPTTSLMSPFGLDFESTETKK